MGVLIKDIQRNNNEIIRIEVSEFKGKELINLRIWYVADRDSKGNDIYKPTQKGIALNISEFSELKDGIDRLQAYINDRAAGTMPEQLSAQKKVDEPNNDNVDNEDNYDE